MQITNFTAVILCIIVSDKYKILLLLPCIRWSKGCKTPDSSRLEGPDRLHPLPGGQHSTRARQDRFGMPTKSWEHRWTWEVECRTESCSQVELCVLVNDGQHEPHPQTKCKWLQWHNRRTRGGAAKGVELDCTEGVTFWYIPAEPRPEMRGEALSLPTTISW